MKENQTITRMDKDQSGFTAKITLKNAILLTLASMMGASIYTLLGGVIYETRTGIYIVIAIDVIIAFLIAGCYSECASLYPKSGGSFVYVVEAFGEKGLYIGWMIWLSNMAYAALVTTSVGLFIADIFNIDSLLFIIIIDISVLLIFTYINAKGADLITKIQNVFIIALLMSLILAGIYVFSKPQIGVLDFEYIIHGLGLAPVLLGVGKLLNAFIGFEDTAAIAEEIIEPEKNVPKALFYAVGIGTCFYVLVIMILMYGLPLDTIGNSEIPLLNAVESNKLLYYIVYFGAVFALLTSIGVAVMASSRNLYALAKRDFIDRKWAKIEIKNDVPRKALILSVTIIIIIVLSGEVEYIATISTISYIITIVAISLTVLKFRKTREYDNNSFKIPLFPYSVILLIVLNIIVLCFMEIGSVMLAIIWFLIGLMVYIYFNSKNRVYGTIFLIITFFIAIQNIIIGIVILIMLMFYYIFKITYYRTILYTLLGLKFTCIAIFIYLFSFLELNDAHNSVALLSLFIIMIIIISISIYFDLNLTKLKDKKEKIQKRFYISNNFMLGMSLIFFVVFSCLILFVQNFFMVKDNFHFGDSQAFKYLWIFTVIMITFGVITNCIVFRKRYGKYHPDTLKRSTEIFIRVRQRLKKKFLGSDPGSDL